ncbi:hypothetical protein [Sphingomonas sp. BK235]|uniref:hypothetical protein n=1 Tax=Sphingomonas sp. BK235 TaxID=2512131 RepID=UPI0010503255|nr:hypothetical protein [Sphingomonas sp. BK235]TCP32693.1 hypothetical protein EV292_10731 [Sphingomonas sp. BK235]
MDQPAMTFSYHRGIAPMLWVLACLATIELLVTHALLSVWFPRIALALSALSLVALVWLCRAIASLRRRPVLVAAEQVVLRAGSFRSVVIARGAIAAVRLSGLDAATVKRRDVLNLALIAFPNVLVTLRAPLPGRRAISAIAHRLDDPAAFAAALEPLGERA